jgi:HK97 family phage prohead protease
MTDTDTEYELETRQFEFRARSVDRAKREIVGTAVPFNQDANIGNWIIERFAPGSVQDSEGALLFWRHQEPIGRLTGAEDSATGWEIVARVSETSLGNDALTLAEDGVVTELSVGFEPGGDYTVEERDSDIPIVTRTRVRVREVSLVPFGAYGDGAKVTEVRERTQPKENRMTDTDTALDNAALTLEVRELRDAIEEYERRMAAFTPHETEASCDNRSAGQIVMALAANDDDTLRYYNQLLEERAYTGGTSADAPIKDAWVGDLTRIFDASSGVLSAFFSEDTLPNNGNNIEFAELLANTVAFTEQTAEGDDLAYGKVTLTTRTAPVKTYGGYTQLTRKQIERSTLPILNRTLEALAAAAGSRAKANLRAAYEALYTARAALGSNAGVVVLGAVLASSTMPQWTASIIDAAVKFEAENLDIEGLIVSTSVFKKFDSFYDTTGRPLFDRGAGGTSNILGTLRLPGLTGNLEGITVACDTGASGDKAAYANSRAIRHYKSGLVQLQDENIINLSKDFSAYRYGAVAPEIPAGVVPVKFAAS